MWLLPPKPEVLNRAGSFYQEVLHHPDWVAEPKRDGYRCLMWLDPTGAKAFTRRGAPLLPATKALSGATHPERVVLDGEWFKGEYWVFDIPYGKGCLRERHTRLVPLVTRLAEKFPIALVERWEKVSAFAKAMSQGLEGIVLKHQDHYYDFSHSQRTTPLWLKVKP